MVDTVLIEVATSLPEWMFSGWHFTLLAGLLSIVFITAVILYNHGMDEIGEIAEFVCFFSFIASAVWMVLSLGFGGLDRVIPDEEAERVATEISEVTEVGVTPEQVQGMPRGKYIPGVNYDILTGSDGGLVLKVEVQK